MAPLLAKVAKITILHHSLIEQPLKLPISYIVRFVGSSSPPLSFKTLTHSSQARMPEKKIRRLLALWAVNALATGGTSPFSSKTELYQAIDSISDGTAPWRCFPVKYTGPKPTNGPILEWMEQEYEVWYRDSHELLKSMLENPAFDGHLDYVSFKEHDPVGKRRYKNLFSGDWVWEKLVRLNF